MRLNTVIEDSIGKKASRLSSLSPFSLSSLSLVAENVNKRDVGYASKDRLDSVILYLIGELPSKIDHAKKTIEDDIRKTNLKKDSQGWSIIFGSYKDIYSDWVINSRSVTNFGGINTIYNYGFLFFYGIGFGAPLLVGHESSTLHCDSNTFLGLINKYGLGYGVGKYFDPYDEADTHSLGSRVAEFELISATKLDCVLSRADDHIEAAEVQWKLEELIAALNLRAELEDNYQ